MKKREEIEKNRRELKKLIWSEITCQTTELSSYQIGQFEALSWVLGKEEDE